MEYVSTHLISAKTYSAVFRCLPRTQLKKEIHAELSTEEMKIRPNKEWQDEITKELRIHTVYNMVSRLLPQGMQVDPSDERCQVMLHYCNGVERIIFQRANSLNDYYRLLAKKTSKLRRIMHNRLLRKLTPNSTGALNAADSVHHPGHTHEARLFSMTSSSTERDLDILTDELAEMEMG